MTTNLKELEELRGCSRKTYSIVRLTHNKIATSEVRKHPDLQNTTAQLGEAINLLIELDNYFVREIKKATRDIDAAR